MTVVWKPVPSWEGIYEVSNTGLVRNVISGRTKVFDTNTSGYKRVQLVRDGRMERFFVHRLVASQFCEGFFEGAVVNHKDANKTNNEASNLEWVTRSENSKHAHRIGHQPGSFRHIPVCVEFSNGVRKFYSCMKDCAKELGICKTSLYAILNNKNGYIKDTGARLMRCVMRTDNFVLEA